jgi:hypothetical protein
VANYFLKNQGLTDTLVATDKALCDVAALEGFTVAP